MDLNEWAVCPESSCDSTEPVNIDTVDQGNGYVFISFRCEDCGSGSLEDDFRWWVRCPICMDDGDIPTDAIEHEITEDGAISLKCTECGESIEKFPETKWG